MGNFFDQFDNQKKENFFDRFDKSRGLAPTPAPPDDPASPTSLDNVAKRPIQGDGSAPKYSTEQVSPRISLPDNMGPPPPRERRPAEYLPSDAPVGRPRVLIGDLPGPADGPSVDPGPKYDPFRNESLGDTAKRKAQFAVQGVGGIAKGVAEGIAITGAMIDMASRDAAPQFLKSNAAQQKMIVDALQQDNLSPLRKKFLEAKLSALQYGFAKMDGLAKSDYIPANKREGFKKGDELLRTINSIIGPPDPRDTSFSAKTSEALGSMIGFLGLTLTTGIVGGAGVGALVNESQLYNEAKKADLDDKQAFVAARIGALIGTTEVLPIEHALRRLPGLNIEKINSAIAKRLVGAAISSGEEGIQEGGQQILNNLVAQGLYDPKRGWSDGATESAIIGAITGAPMGAAFAHTGSNPKPTQGDIQSPLPTDKIVEGKKIIQDAIGGGSQSAPVSAETIIGAPEVPTAQDTAPQGLTASLDQPQMADAHTSGLFQPSSPVPPRGLAPVSRPDVSTVSPDVPPPPAAEAAPTTPSQVDAPKKASAPSGITVLTNEDIPSIQTAPDTFQYKSNADHQGVTDRLKGVTKWDANRSGIGIVYEYKDGRRVIVDGHQRLALAKRAAADGQNVEFPVRVFKQADGITERDARIIGAEKNIAEGSGSAIDAAKIFRETGKKPADINLPPNSAIVRDGDNLANLSDEAFGMVTNEVAPIKYGSVVGRVVKDKAKQSDILKLLVRLSPSNAAQAESIARQADQAGSTTTTQTDLFGEQTVSENLYLERAKVLDKALKDLGANISTFKTLTKRGDTIQSEGNILNEEANKARLKADAEARAKLLKLANMKGPVSDALTEAARKYKETGKLADASQAFIEAFRQADGMGQEGWAAAGGPGPRSEQTQTAGSETQSKPDQKPVVEDFTAKSVIVRGVPKDTTLWDGMKARPLWNKKEGGWVFSKKRRQEVVGRIAGKAQTKPANKDTLAIGKNYKGQTLFEDKNGVRSYLDHSVLVSEPVDVVPGQSTPRPSPNRSKDFLTTAEADMIDGAGKKTETPKDNFASALTKQGFKEIDPGRFSKKITHDNGAVSLFNVSVKDGEMRVTHSYSHGSVTVPTQVIETTSNPKKVADAIDASVKKMAPKQESQAPKPSEKKPYDASVLTTDEQKRLDELRAKFKAKINNQLNAGIDPELVSISIEMATIYVKAGARKFKQLVDAMMSDLGLSFDVIQPYARNAYNHVRDEMSLAGEDTSGMDTTDQVIQQIKEMRDGGPQDETQKIAEDFRDAFKNGETFKTIVEARKRAAEILGRDVTEADHKAIEEAIEVGITMYADEIASSNMGAAEKFSRLVDLYNAQPKLSQRTSTSVEQQAYSTPAPLAFVASRIAGVDNNTTIYEPTAGNGMLLIGANKEKVTANELNPDRAKNLRIVLGDKANITEGNALEVTPPKVDVVIANPPFGKVRDSAGKPITMPLGNTGITTTNIDHAIAFKSLEAIGDNGRAVFIVGGHQGDADARLAKYRAPANGKFYKALYDAYNVTEHFTVDGSLYSRQGASWPVDVIVIEGKGKSEKPYPMAVVPHVYGSWKQIGERVDGKDSLDTREQLHGGGVGDVAATLDAIVAEPIPGPSGNGNQQDGGGRGSGDGATSSGSSVRDGENQHQQEKPAGNGADNGGEQQLAAGAQRDGSGDVASAGEQVQGDQAGTSRGAASSGGLAGAPVSRRKRVNTEQESDLSVQYTPRSNAIFAVGTLVPKNMQLAMNRALDNIEQRVGGIDTYVADKLGYSVDEVVGTKDKPGYFSAEQVDAIALAIDNVERGAGFIIGDQTGVGKGRFVAAMMRYADRNGLIPVFITKQDGLYADMVRDMRDIGMPRDVTKQILMTNSGITGSRAIAVSDQPNDTLLSLTKTKLNMALPKMERTGTLPKGVGAQDHRFLFTTYSQLQTVRGEETQRMRAIRAIAPNAMFILDESHEAGGGQANARAKKDEKGKTRAEFIRGLLGSARGVVYSSATYAKNPHVMSLYFKTDLSLAVDNINKLSEAVSAGGVPLQQVMANMLVEAGQYARRERSFAGVSIDLKPMETNKEVSDKASSVMREIFRLDTDFMDNARSEFIDNAASLGFFPGLDVAIGDASVSSTGFSSMLHNVVSQFLLSIKADAVVNEAIALHKSGSKPIIALSNTNEAILNDYIEMTNSNVGDHVAIPFNQILERYIDRLRRVTVKDANDVKHHVYMTDKQILRFGGEEALREFNRVKEMVRNADLSGLPGSPIDYIADKMRGSGLNVGEITGRQVHIVGGILEKRNSSTAAKVNTMRGFNNGSIDALIINRSGSTGFSLHATEKNDGKKRHMLILQADPNIDVFMQMLGRIHRTGQVKLPAYTIAVSDLAVEKRPAAVLMRKMASLSANTTASKKSAISLDNVTDFLNKYGDRVVADLLLEDTDLQNILDITVKPKEINGLAAKVTGRLAILEPKQVEDIYARIEAAYNDYIAALDRMGVNTLEAKTLDLDAKEISSVEIVPAKDSTSPFGAAANITTVDVKKLGKPYSSAQVEDEVQKAKSAASTDEKIASLEAKFPNVEKEITDAINREASNIEKAKTDKQRSRAKDAKKRWEDKLSNARDAMNRIKSELRSLEPGNAFYMQVANSDEGSGQKMYAVSLGADISKVKSNPLAASTISVRFAIADAGKEIRVPLSKLISAESEYSLSPISGEDRKRAMRAFDAGQTEAREIRQIVTGNLVAGFAKFEKGQIILYTDSDGNVHRGIMLPKDFNAKSELEKQPVLFASGDQIVRFLTGGEYNSRMVKTSDGIMAISYNGTNFTISVKTRGGKPYILNKTVRNALGDFSQRQGAKVYRNTVYDAQRLSEALSAYQDELGAEFVTETSRQAAREITGEKIPEISDQKTMMSVKTGDAVTPRAKQAAAKIRASLNDRAKKLGLGRIEVKVVDNLFGRLADGTVVDANGTYVGGVISVSLSGDKAAIDTFNHEAIHALKDMGAFRSAEWKTLERKARADKKAMEEARAKYPGESESVIVEEVIANMYADYAAGRMKPKGFVRDALARISRIIEATRNLLRGYGFKTADDVFGAVSRGEVGKRGASTELTSAEKMSRAEASDRRSDSYIKAVLKQPLDQAIRVPFNLAGGIDYVGRWKPGVSLEMAAEKFIKETKLPDSAGFGWINDALYSVRAGIIDRYGLPTDYIERERRRGLDERAVMAEALDILHELSKADLSPAESKTLHAILTGEKVDDARLNSLAKPIRESIDNLGKEAVRLGLISRESYERNKGEYLHRVYAKYENEMGGMAKTVAKVISRRRKKIIGNQFKGRGMFLDVKRASIVKNLTGFREAKRGAPVVGDKFIILDKMSNPGQKAINGLGKEQKILERIYLPANEPIPSKYSDWENRGTWEVRNKKGADYVLWRDFTKEERQSMGEIVDAQYTIAKTYMLMAHDLATGRFYKDIADNEEWATKQQPADGTWKDAGEYNRFWADRSIQWVLVPKTKISKSNTYRYGALAGMYVRAEIWRDLAELEKINSKGFFRSLMTQWKLNKTARNPVVHTNNIMSNMILMDLADVTVPDLLAALKSYAEGDKHYQDALEYGAFGADIVANELRDNTLKPILKEIANSVKDQNMGPSAKLGLIKNILTGISKGVGMVKYADRKMMDAYQAEDEIFRMATYISLVNKGMSPAEAALEARDQFLNYDIRAPWINVLRRSFVPFIGYSYRAVPMIAKSIAHRPWKIAKYYALSYALNAAAYSVAPSGDDQDKERRSLRSQEQGYTWFGTPRMMRLPSLDKYGNPVFLDVRRWIPAGDVFDMNQGHAAISLPAPLQPGGPLMIGAELALNRQAFTGREIVNNLTDTTGDRIAKVSDYLWKSWMPSAAWVPNSWYWEKISRAASGATEWGTGRPYDMTQAILSSFGIKVKPQDVQGGFERWRRDFVKIEKDLKYQARRLRSDRERGIISQQAYQRGMDELLNKLADMKAERRRIIGR